MSEHQHPKYVPPQRSVRCEILTPAGWVDASVVLAETHALHEHIEGTRPFLTLVDAALPHFAQRMPFFALNREEAILLAPDPEDARLEGVPVPERVKHVVSCLLTVGHLRGALELLAGTRVSDHLAHREGFLLLRDARLLTAAAAGLVERYWPVVLVNARSVVGVVDS